MATSVHDPNHAIADPAMPMLRLALDPGHMDHCLAQFFQEQTEPYQSLPASLGQAKFLLQAIQVRRHKPGRRCLIEYQLFCPEEAVFCSVLGKIRAKGLDHRSYDAQRRLWQNGFDTACADKICVPEPIGKLPHLSMWIQKKVEAKPVIHNLAENRGLALAARLAQAVHKLHSLGVTTLRSHTRQDELRILHQQLAAVIASHPAWKKRIEKILAECTQLSGSLPQLEPCPSHRDFYHDNVLFDGEKLFLVDLDLYCLADPGLDLGNFIAHLMDYSLRRYGDANTLSHITQMLRSSVNLSSKNDQSSCTRQIDLYTSLSLARLVAISTRIADRAQWTLALMDLCEQSIEQYKSTA